MVDNPSLVVVAVPSQDDPAWKISSEKVPHLTILYLGETEKADVSKISAFVEHAASTLSRFGLSIDHRGVLGEDDADVVFFDDRYIPRDLKDFRSNLLGNSEIKKAYDSVQQFPKWTPHLTLGYPKAPAKPSDYPITYVNFDRVAVWYGDYEGDEFLLESERFLDLAHNNQEAIDDFLTHYGIKGMRWGVRRSDAQLARINKKQESLDEQQDKLNAKASKAGLVKVELSEDAKAAAELFSKRPEELSNSELKTASDRARLLNDYNKLFAPAEKEGKSPLQMKVEELRLQKEYAELRRALTPEKKSRVASLAKKAQSGFSAYKQVDTVLKGQLTNSISNKLGLTPKLSLAEKLKAENDLFQLRRNNAVHRAELNKYLELNRHLIEGDAPSLATEYRDAGKRKRGAGAYVRR